MSPSWQMEPWNAVPSGTAWGLLVGSLARMVPSHQRGGSEELKPPMGPSFSSTLGGLRLSCWAMASWQVLELCQQHKLRNWNDWFKRHWNVGENFEWNGEPQQHNEQLSRFFTGHTDRLTGRNLESAHLCLQPWANAAPRRLPVWGAAPVDCCRRYTTWIYLVSRGLWTKPVQEISPFLNQCKAIDVLGLNLPKSTHHFRLVLLLCVILQPG